MSSEDLHGVSVEQRGTRYRVLRTYPNGQCQTLGIYGHRSAAIEAATALVLRIEQEGS